MSEQNAGNASGDELRRALLTMEEKWCVQWDGEVLPEDSFRAYAYWHDVVRPLLGVPCPADECDRCRVPIYAQSDRLAPDPAYLARHMDDLERQGIRGDHDTLAFSHCKCDPRRHSDSNVNDA